jgi:hypothetical protein
MRLTGPHVNKQWDVCDECIRLWFGRHDYVYVLDGRPLSEWPVLVPREAIEVADSTATVGRLQRTVEELRRAERDAASMRQTAVEAIELGRLEPDELLTALRDIASDAHRARAHNERSVL